MRRTFYLAVGWLMVGLGIIGAILPIVPTVPFLLVAAAAFARSSPELEARLMNHPRFGSHLKQWRREGAIETSAKLLAIVAMACSFVSVLVFAPAFLWLQVSIGVVLFSCAVFVATRPAPSVVRDEA